MFDRLRHPVSRVSILVAAASLGAAATLFLSLASENGVEPPSSAEIERSECRSGVQSYRQAVTYYRAQNAVLISAARACGSGRSERMELDDVRVSIRRDGKLLAEYTAPTGSYWSRQGRLLLTENITSLHPGRKGPLTLTIDLRTGEVRSPGERVILKADADHPTG